MLINAAISMAKESGLLAKEKYETASVRAVLNLGKRGQYKGFTHPGADKKSVNMWVPQRVSRGSNVDGQFIVDNAKFMLGLEGKQKHIDAYFKLLDPAIAGTNDEGLKALKTFLLNSKDVDKAKQEFAETFKLDGNIVVRYEDGFLHEREAVNAFWLNFQMPTKNKPSLKICSLCGELRETMRIHPKIMGDGGLSTRLISFNEVTDSYGHKEGDNFPVCSSCSAAYSIALQRLLKADFNHPVTGEKFPQAYLVLDRATDSRTVAVYWGAAGAPQIDLRSVFEEGHLESIPEGDDSDFYYAVLAQQSQGRMTIKDFIHTTLAERVSNLRKYFDDLRICAIPEYVKDAYTPKFYVKAFKLPGDTYIWTRTNKALFTCAMNPRVKFPHWMYSRILLRAKRGVHSDMASLIKAILIRNYGANMTPELNPNQFDPAYQFGRYFAVVEYAHRKAINSDRTLSEAMLPSAVTSPLSVQLRLKQKLDICVKKKPELGFLMKESNGIWDNITTPLPLRFSLEQQGMFTMGYYHQLSHFYTKKEDRTDA